MVLFHNAGMDYQQSEFLWKCMVAPYLVNLHDIAQFFFEHSLLGLKIFKTAKKKKKKSCIVIFAKNMSKKFSVVLH
jgi:hypothetical protein